MEIRSELVDLMIPGCQVYVGKEHAPLTIEATPLEERPHFIEI